MISAMYLLISNISLVFLFLAPDQMLTTVQKDFVPLNSRRQELSPSQLQQVKYLHFTSDKLQFTGLPFILQSMKSKHRHWSLFLEL